MRFKDDNDNRYRVNFTRATEAHIDKMTVAEFIEYLENNAEFEDESTPHIYRRQNNMVQRLHFKRNIQIT